MKANNYSQLVKAFESHGISYDLSKVPTDIRDSEKKYFHLVAISVRDNPGQIKKQVNVSILQKHEVDYRMLVKGNSYLNHGINFLFILHNPTEESDYHELIKPKVVKTEAEIKAEVMQDLMISMSGQNAELIKALKDVVGGISVGNNANLEEEKLDVKELIVDTQEVKDINTSSVGVINLEGMKSAHPNDLRKFAKEHSIDLGTASKKAEIMPIIESWVIDYNNSL